MSPGAGETGQLVMLIKPGNRVFREWIMDKRNSRSLRFVLTRYETDIIMEVESDIQERIIREKRPMTV